MKAKIVVFSSYGDTTLLEYEPATADMEEVNKVIAVHSHLTWKLVNAYRKSRGSRTKS